jgi:hypothetical protein
LYAILKNWVAQYKHHDSSTCNAPHDWTTWNSIDQIHELTLKDCRISAKSIAGQLGISHERVGSIIHEDLDLWKLSAKWAQKLLKADEKRQQCLSSE